MRILRRGIDWDLDPDLEETDELDLGDVPGGRGVNEAVWTPELYLLPRFRKEDGMMGYWNLRTDRWEIEPIFKKGSLFHDGVAAVCFDDYQWFFIDSEWNIIDKLGLSTWEPKFSEEERRIFVHRIGGWGVIDYEGGEVYPCVCWDYVDGYRNGICSLKRTLLGNDYVYIDVDGHVLDYDIIHSCPDGNTVIKMNGQTCILTPERRIIEIPQITEYDSYLGPGLFRINDDCGRFGASDVDGKTIIPTEYWKIEQIGADGLFPVTFDQGAYYVDMDNNVHLDFGFKDTMPFNCYGFAAASNEEGYFGIIDSDGDFVFPPTFKYIYEIETMLWEGRYEDGKVVLIGPDLNIVDCQLDLNSIRFLREGLLNVTIMKSGESNDESSTYAFIDRYGEVKISPFTGYFCQDFHEGLAEFYYDDDLQEEGLMDHWGTIVKYN